jgi:imidazolonepropionase-like amidohydrolase
MEAGNAPLILTARRVWDGLADRPMDNGFVRVEDGRITAIGRAADLASDVVARDLDDVTLMPGLINAHVHITFNASTVVLDDYLRERDAGTETLMRRAEDNLTKAIAAGCTTIRDLGTLNDIVFTARERVRRGSLVGPDIVAAGEGITSKGGHCHFFGVEAEGVEDVRAAVRRQHDAGADLIKVFATGGNLTPDTDPFSPQYSVEELSAVVDEARKHELPVASHAHAPEGIKRSVQARVDTIEHCFFETPDGPAFDERVVAKMAEAGIAVCPTAGVSLFPYLADPELIETLPPPARPIVGRLVKNLLPVLANFRRMRDLGVRIIAGTDAGIPQRPFDSFAADLGAFADGSLGLGMGSRTTMLAATSECAGVLGLDDRGTLTPGKRADLLAVAGNPLERIEDVQQTRLVMVAGRIALDASS